VRKGVRRMKWVTRGVVAGVVALVASMGVGMLVGALVPGLAAEYGNTQMFRPYNDPLMYLFYVSPLLTGVILAWVYVKVSKLIGGGDWWRRGGRFGLAYFVVASLPGMFISYTSFNVSMVMVLSWTLSSLVQAIVMGLVLAYWESR
jgi:hypothetical protein